VERWTPRQIELARAFCRYVEMARAVKTGDGREINPRDTKGSLERGARERCFLAGQPSPNKEENTVGFGNFELAQ
jgi:hypothetical protein